MRIHLEVPNIQCKGEYMAEWHKFLLTYDNIFDKTIELQNEFNSLFLQSTPQERESATMMTKINRNGILFYFTPSASQIARSILDKNHSIQCSEPILDENLDGYQLSYSAGDKKYFYKYFSTGNKIEV